MNRPLRKLLAVGAVAALGAAVAVTAALSASASPSQSTSLKAGGTLRNGWEAAFNFSDNFDPTGEYLGDAVGIQANLLIRTLVNYNHVPGVAGNVVVPDAATSVPKPTNGGKTYTFHLKSGIKFSPPVNREVTSKDFKYAAERLANPKDGGEYAFYGTVIKGWSDYAAGKAKTISGIQTPNNSTIVFNLTQPTGDFLLRLTMPAWGPIPVEVAKCFEGQPGKYAQDLVSTAGYMIQGADKVDDSSCSALKPMSGYDGQTKLILVRNPNYEQKTDPTRKNLINEFDFTIDSSADDIYAKIQQNELDMAISSIPPQVLAQYATDKNLRSHFFQNLGDRTWFLTMNLTQPPFDDIHVRKAMNWIMDKPALIQGWGGPVIGKVANHIVPDLIFNNQLAEFAPYKTPGDHGSLAKAKLAMKGSKYDTAGNGTCSAPQCKNVLFVVDTRQIDTKMLPVIQADAAKIGITFKVRVINGAYPTIQTPKNNVPFAERPGWGKDFADAETFFTALFDGRNIQAAGNVNYPLVGITPAIAKKVGVTGNVNGVPSVNSQLDKCAVLAGQTRMTCYENVDKYLMLNVVPWVPYLWSYVTRITSDNVTHYQYDQSFNTPAYSQMAVKS